MCSGGLIYKNESGYGLVVEQMLPKHLAGVRFSLSAPILTNALINHSYKNICLKQIFFSIYQNL